MHLMSALPITIRKEQLSQLRTVQRSTAQSSTMSGGPSLTRTRRALTVKGGTINGTFEVEEALKEDAATKIVITGGSFKDAAGNDYNVPDDKILSKADNEEMYSLKDAVHVTFDADNARGDDSDARRLKRARRLRSPQAPTKDGISSAAGILTKGDSMTLLRPWTRILH